MVDKNTKEKLELKIENDGEFWMSFEDWLRNFDNCQICNLTPDTINDISEKDWENSRLLSVIKDLIFLINLVRFVEFPPEDFIFYSNSYLSLSFLSFFHKNRSF